MLKNDDASMWDWKGKDEGRKLLSLSVAVWYGRTLEDRVGVAEFVFT